MQVGNVDLDSNTIKVLGKRNKERLIPLGDGLRQTLETYENARIGLGKMEDSSFYFLTLRGKKVYPKLVYRVVNDYLGRVSTIRKKSPHVLRHTFATHLLNRGADINAIKEILGHESLAATQVYTHNSIEELIKVYKGSHPRGNV
jgi:integrase/recombinase XerC